MNFLNQIPSQNRSHIFTIANKLMESGYTCYLVGGSVRDLVMNKVPIEYDLATNAEPELVATIFPKVFKTGIRHGTVTVLIDKVGYEVTTFRSEYGYKDGRRPDEVDFGVSLEDDLERRDFTMNALCLDLQSGEVIDLHNGLNDIQNKIIRTIGDPIERFSEDGLRPIRGIRFASTLGFSIEESTEKAFIPTKHITQKISVERFQVELSKILSSENPKIGISLLVKYGYLKLFTEYSIRDNPIEKYLDLMDAMRKEKFFNKEFLPWLFFLKIWIQGINFPIKNNPLNDFKLSNEIEKDTLFFLTMTDNLERIHDFHPKRIDSIKPIFYNIEYINLTLIQEILSPIRDYSNRHSTWNEDGIHNILFNFFLPFIENTSSHFDILKCVNLIKEKRIPLVLKDLAIDGNWVQQKYPQVRGIMLGKLLKNCLQEIWTGKVNNDSNSIEKYLSSNTQLFT